MWYNGYKEIDMAMLTAAQAKGLTEGFKPKTW
jgi:hypothetical protein